jgi:uncharacterized protein (DUF1015 family)
MRRMTAGPGQTDPAAPGPSSTSVPRPAGLVLSPFRALRFDPDVAGDLADLTSPPYDVLDDGAVAALEARNDANVVRLILPRDEPGGADRYQRAASLLERWRADGVLTPDPEPALYVYEQGDPVSGHVQRGLLGALSLSPAEDGIVLPHESTMAGPVADRLALYTATRADLEPIFLVYDGGGAASRAVADVESGPAPLVDAVLTDGLRHRLWALTDRGLLAEIAADLLPRKALIADGHHRYATYLRRQADRHEAGAGAGPWDSGLCLLVDATAFGPQVHPIHRVVPGQPVGVLAERAARGAAVRRLDGTLEQALAELATARRAGAAFVLSDGDPTPAGERYLVAELDAGQLAQALPGDRSPAWGALDVTVLHEFVVPRLWQLPDDEGTVGFEHDVDAALRRAAAAGGAAVLLGPTAVEDVAAVAAAGERMPRKSTLFTPKPRTGLVLRDFRDA